MTLLKAKNISQILLLAMTLLTVIFLFNHYAHVFFEEKSYDTVERLSSTYTDTFKGIVREQAKILTSIGQFFLKNKDMTFEEYLKVLTIFIESGTFKMISVSDSNGKITTRSGSEINISESKFFVNALKGDVTVTEYFDFKDYDFNFTDKIIADESTFAVCVPIFKNAKVVGTVQSTFNSTDIKTMLPSYFFSNNYGWISDRNGDVVLSIDNEYQLGSNQNILEFLGNAIFESKYEFQEFYYDFENGNSSAFIINHAGNKLFVGMTPVGINDWQTFSVTTDDNYNHDYGIVMNYIILLSIILLFVFIVYGFIIIKTLKRSYEKNEIELKESEERFRVALYSINNSVFDGMIEASLTENIIISTQSSQLNVPTQSGIDKKYTEFSKSYCDKYVHENYRNEYLEKTSIKYILDLYEKNIKYFEFEFLQKTDNGEFEWYTITTSTYYSTVKDCIMLVGFLKNINKEKLHIHDLTIRSQTDLLTNLYNKISTQNLITETLENYNSEYSAFLLLDIDNFKNVNDTFGHAFGDTVIVKMATLLKGLFRECDIVGRIGGDEFVAFLSNVKSKKDIISKAEKIKSVFESAEFDENNDFKISFSIGIVYTNKNLNFDIYYKNADIALYNAKHAGKNTYKFYTT